MADEQPEGFETSPERRVEASGSHEVTEIDKAIGLLWRKGYIEDEDIDEARELLWSAGFAVTLRPGSA